MSGTIRPMRLWLVVAGVMIGLAGVGAYFLSTIDGSPVRAASVYGWTLRYEIIPIEDSDELALLHREAADAFRGQCVACHGDREDSELVVHRIHLESELLPGLLCQDCHPSVELGPRDETTTTRWVDVGFCKTCHSEFPGSGEHPHTCEADSPDAECLECHVDDLEPVHDRPYLPHNVDGEDCKGCHGGRVLPWTPSHEKDDWLPVHGEEALDSGGETCFECHDFGLKFCDECHSVAPPSHLPEDRWRHIHPEEAQADTRVCYSCHDTSHCKLCHVNHEEGWMDTHPSFVEERGDDTCDECHSRTSCSFCHTDLLLLGESSLETTSQ